MTARKARQQLNVCIRRAYDARGEAQWTNGYRAGNINANDVDRMRQKEQAQWLAVTVADAAVERALRAYARAIRLEAAR